MNYEGSQLFLIDSRIAFVSSMDLVLTLQSMEPFRTVKKYSHVNIAWIEDLKRYL